MLGFFERCLSTASEFLIGRAGRLLGLTAGLIFCAQVAGAPAGNLVSWGKITMPYVEAGTEFSQVNIASDSWTSSTTLALRRDGVVYAWGWNSFAGLFDVPPAAHYDVKSLVADTSHCFVVKRSGEVVGWGRVWNGTEYVNNAMPADIGPVSQLASGNRHFVVLRENGTVAEWALGPQGYTRVDVPLTAANIVSVSAGGSHSVAVHADGTVTAWGNIYDPINGGMIPVPIPPNLGDVRAIASGNNFIAALMANGSVSAWGFVDWGTQLTEEEWRNSSSPTSTAVSGRIEMHDVVKIAAGDNFLLGLKRDGTVVSWGRVFPQVGFSDYEGVLTVPLSWAEQLRNVQDITCAGSRSTILFADGTIKEWNGIEPLVQLGVDTFVSAAAGANSGPIAGPFAVALRNDGKAFVVGGANYGGRLSIPNGARTGVIALVCGYTHTAALKADGTVLDWGLYGSLGPTMKHIPQISMATISAGSGTTGGARLNGQGVFWYGRTKGNDVEMGEVPPRLAAGALAINPWTYCGLTLYGEVIEWSYSESGFVYPDVPSLARRDVVAIAQGPRKLALRSDGTIVEWDTTTLIPTSLNNNAVAVSAGAGVSLALKADGTIVGWGRGAGTNIPSTVQGRSIAIAAGFDVGIAIVSTSDEIKRPRLSVHPVNQVLHIGSRSSFVCVAAGEPPLYYQWAKDGRDLNGATNPSLALPNATAADCGSYSVRVSNSYGTVESRAASLAVLGDGSNGNRPMRLQTPALPSPDAEKENLVFITHGVTPKAYLGTHEWVDEMANLIKANLGTEANKWMIYPYKWVEDARLGGPADSRSALQILDVAKKHGSDRGKDLLLISEQITRRPWKHLHLIAHSAGSELIHEISRIISSDSRHRDSSIHMTFLDPYTGITDHYRDKYGQFATWSDHYFTFDSRDTHNDILARTDGPLLHAVNYDITGIDPLAERYPVDYDSFQWDSTHSWPWQFYLSTVAGTQRACATGTGYAFSAEAGGWNARPRYQIPGPSIPMCDVQRVVTLPPPPVRIEPFIRANFIPVAGSIGADSFSSGFSLRVPGLSPYIGLLGTASAVALDGPSPAWIAMALTVTNAVNFVRFQSAFLPESNGHGLASVYLNTNLIGILDEESETVEIQTHDFALPRALTSGIYTLSFRLDGFNGGTSFISVTNITLGFVGVPDPITLTSLSLGPEGRAEFVINGPPGYRYLVQRSADLTDWFPAALVSNPDGSTRFFEWITQPSGTLFYRAVIP